MRITGTVKYINLAMGFWGIEAEDGKKWMPLNMPNQLQVEGAKVTVSLMKVSAMTTAMWGEVCQITRFETLDT